jgi:GT2 family glycosyltransferase/LPS sulfotransferase NodH
MRATGVAGRPEEYFNASLRPLYMQDLGLRDDAAAEAVLQRMLATGTTDNGVFGAKLHRLQYASLLDLLRDATGDQDGDEISLLTSVFPGLTLVHHDRLDRLGQALSWHRALATDNWWHVRGLRDIRAEDDLVLDIDRVRVLERRLRADDAAWTELFRRSGLPIVRSTYEDLVGDYEGTVRRLVAAVAGTPGALVPPPNLIRQSDRTTERWRVQYQRAIRRGNARAGASIVVVSHNEGGNLPQTVAALRRTTPPGTEVVVVDDCSTDGSVETTLATHPDVTVVRPGSRLGVARARNAGAEAATGDVVVFSDAHVLPADGWLPALLEALEDPEVGEVAPTVCDMHDGAIRGFGFTWPDLSMRVQWLRDEPGGRTDVPFICGCFLAMRRATFDELGGFDDGLIRWGSEDAELSLRVWRRGLRCVVVPDAVVAHLFRPTFGYTVQWEHTLHNMLRVAAVHFPAEVVNATLHRFADHPAFPAAVASLDLAAVQQRREDEQRVSRRDGRSFLAQYEIGTAA